MVNFSAVLLALCEGIFIACRTPRLGVVVGIVCTIREVGYRPVCVRFAIKGHHLQHLQIHEISERFLLIFKRVEFRQADQVSG